MPKTITCIEHGYSGEYPFIRVNGKLVNGQRLVWQLIHGRELPQGLIIRHTCDNPRCINPGHLVAGTQAENNADARRRGRWRPFGKTPLTTAEKARILNAAMMGNSFAEIARGVGRSSTTVRRVVYGK